MSSEHYIEKNIGNTEKFAQLVGLGHNIIRSSMIRVKSLSLTDSEYRLDALYILDLIKVEMNPFEQIFFFAFGIFLKICK